jgi:hypothetical protein
MKEKEQKNLEKIEKKETINNITYQTLTYTLKNNQKKPEILFVHGWGLPIQSYTKFLQQTALATQKTVTAVNLPGFGGSSSLGEHTNLENLTKILCFCLNKLNQNKENHIIGHSFGAYLILESVIKKELKTKGEIILFNPVGLHDKSFKYYLEFGKSLASEILKSDFNKIQTGGGELMKNPVNLGKTASIALNSNIKIADLKKTNQKINIIVCDQDKITPVTKIDTFTQNNLITTYTKQGNHGWILHSPQEASELVAKITINK